MKYIKIQVWESELAEIGDWCLDNIGGWAFTGLPHLLRKNSLKDYIVSNLTWKDNRHSYVGGMYKKCWLHMCIENDVDILAVTLRWNV